MDPTTHFHVQVFRQKAEVKHTHGTANCKLQTFLQHSLALISGLLADLVVELHVDLEDELQLLVCDEGGQRAVDLLAGVHGLPVVLLPQEHLVAAGRLLVVVPTARAFLCRTVQNSGWLNGLHLYSAFFVTSGHPKRFTILHHL